MSRFLRRITHLALGCGVGFACAGGGFLICDGLWDGHYVVGLRVLRVAVGIGVIVSVRLALGRLKQLKQDWGLADGSATPSAPRASPQEARP